jgi:hypothetical protein
MVSNALPADPHQLFHSRSWSDPLKEALSRKLSLHASDSLAALEGKLASGFENLERTTRVHVTIEKSSF